MRKSMWAAEVIGRSETGHVVKIQITYDEEPDHDREAKVRAEVQSVMRRQHQEWCTGPGSISYRKWEISPAAGASSGAPSRADSAE